MPPLHTQSTVGTPARYRAALADPNRRASVPTQYLPPHLRKLRHQAQARKVLLDPTATIAGPALDLAAKRLAGLEINPQVAALKRQEGEATATNQRVAQRVHDYNQQYMASLADATGKAQGPFAEYFKGLQTAAPLAASSAQRDLAYDLAGTLRDIGAKKGELEEKRGALTTEKLIGLRQQQFENIATKETLGLKGQEAATSAAATAAKLKQEASKQAFDQSYKQAQIDIKRGIDPVTGRPLPKKPQSASDALSAWKLQWMRSPKNRGKRPPWLAPTAGGKAKATEDPTEFLNTARKYRSIYGGQIGQVIRDKEGKAVMRGGKAVRVSTSDIRKAMLNKVDDVDLVNGLMDVLSNRYGGKLGPVNRKIWQRRGIKLPAGW